MDAILSRFEQIFGWVPLWMVGLGLVAGAIAAALLVQSMAARLIRRAVGPNRPAVRAFLKKIAGPLRLALCLAAVALVLPLAPLNDLTSPPRVTSGTFVSMSKIIFWRASMSPRYASSSA